MRYHSITLINTSGKYSRPLQAPMGHRAAPFTSVMLVNRQPQEAQHSTYTYTPWLHMLPTAVAAGGAPAAEAFLLLLLLLLTARPRWCALVLGCV
jgi:hypothetical protein